MSIEHENFIKTPKQLIVIVTLSFLVPIALIALLSQLMTSDKKSRPDENPQAVAARIKPVGELAIAGPKVLLTGDKVFESLCHTCHVPGLAGAPKLGDKAVWAPIIKQGQEQAVARAISGTPKGMPPKGGNPDLTNEEVAGAVAYMASKAGANWKAPELKMPSGAPVASAPAIPPVAIPPAQPAAATVPATPLLPPGGAMSAPQAAAGGAAKGKQIYDTTCMVCHATGVANAPKLGDKAAWAPRIAAGTPALYTSVLNGKGAMPPKAGNASLSDADLHSAVDFMVSQAK